MNYKKIYISIYQFLDMYWEKIESETKRIQLDDLGGLLGSMNPNIWSDNEPIDKQIISDWLDISKEQKLISDIEGFSYMIGFLEKQTYWLKLDVLITELKSSLNSKDNNWQLWLKIYNQYSDL